MSSQAEGAVRLLVFDRAWFREEFYTAIQRKHDRAKLQPERKLFRGWTRFVRRGLGRNNRKFFGSFFQKRTASLPGA
jgi:hypothetical protein